MIRNSKVFTNLCGGNPDELDFSNKILIKEHVLLAQTTHKYVDSNN